MYTTTKPLLCDVQITRFYLSTETSVWVVIDSLQEKHAAFYLCSHCHLLLAPLWKIEILHMREIMHICLSEAGLFHGHDDRFLPILLQMTFFRIF